MIATLTLLLLNEIEDDDTTEDTTELEELFDELLTATLEELNTLDALLPIEEILDEATELVTTPQFLTKVQEPSLPGTLCVHQFAL